jgi:predicted RNase H-like HicB family nuclease
MTKTQTETETESATYHARLQLDSSGQWLAELEEIPQVHTFGRTLGKAREYLVDALALWLDVHADCVKDRITFRIPALPEETRDAVQEALAAREISEAIGKLSAEALSGASVALVEDAHLSMRDAADILGISHQRVQQLVAASRSAATPRHGTVPQYVMDVAQSLEEHLTTDPDWDLSEMASSVVRGLAAAWITMHETESAQ